MTTKKKNAQRRRQIVASIAGRSRKTDQEGNVTLTLTHVENLVLDETLQLILGGYDARAHLGIRRKSGSLPQDLHSLVRSGAIASHYWVLRTMEPVEKDLVARAIVAEVWQCGSLHVYKMARMHKPSSLRRISTKSRAANIEDLECLAKTNRLLP